MISRVKIVDKNGQVVFFAVAKTSKGLNKKQLADLAKARKSMMEQEKGKRLIDIL